MQPKKKVNINTAAQRRLQQELQRKRMQKIMWITGSCIVVLVILLLVIKPSSNEKSSDFAYENLPVIGDTNAPVKIVEFGDYKCPACQGFSQSFKPQIVKDYVDKGIVSFYYMNYLIISPEADSNTAALAAQAVYHQNNEEFWKYYHVLYDNQGNEQTEWATPEYLVELARQANLDIDYDKLAKDIADKTYQKEVDEHMKIAQSLNIRSTPTLYINGQKLDGDGSYESLTKAVDDAVASANAIKEEK
ncbi:protein-disulfide isomerase [Paenibacillus sp. DS2015]|uniref:DsbA family protein n=1 Tax=Paenibacillus sp. DS2015 TaxID=3373917 RepID=UPI003D21DF7C